MTRDELSALMVQRLGRTGDTTLGTVIATELQNIQETVCEQHEWLPWFLLGDMTDLATTASQEYVDLSALSSTFLMEDDEGGAALWYYDSSADPGERWTELKKDDYAHLKANDDEEGAPESYSLLGLKLYIFPLADGIYPLKFRCYQADTALSSGSSTNNWLAYGRNVLMYETLAVIAGEYLQNTELAANFKLEAAKAWKQLYKVHIARREAGAMRNAGDD